MNDRALSWWRAVWAPLVLCISLAAGVPSAAAPGPKACDASLNHQFDFWVGNWIVYDWTTKKLAGHNNVTSEYGGCVVQEHWTAAGATMRGSSFNAYDKQRKVWHQTWVDDQGTVLLLDGNFTGGAMVLSGTGIGRSGKHYRQRITFTPLPGGDVRQRWEISTDGTTWKPVFDGRYTK